MCQRVGSAGGLHAVCTCACGASLAGGTWLDDRARGRGQGTADVGTAARATGGSQICYNDAHRVWNACAGLMFKPPFQDLSSGQTASTFAPAVVVQLMRVVFQALAPASVPDVVVRKKGSLDCYALPGLAHGSATCPPLPSFIDALATYPCVADPAHTGTLGRVLTPACDCMIRGVCA